MSVIKDFINENKELFIVIFIGIIYIIYTACNKPTKNTYIIGKVNETFGDKDLMECLSKSEYCDVNINVGNMGLVENTSCEIPKLGIGSERNSDSYKIQYRNGKYLIYNTTTNEYLNIVRNNLVLMKYRGGILYNTNPSFFFNIEKVTGGYLISSDFNNSYITLNKSSGNCNNTFEFTNDKGLATIFNIK
jgi:hypothetical protein